MESAVTDTINPESSFDEGLRLHFLLLNRRENKEITQMKRKSSRISTSSASVSTQSLVSTIAAEKKADKPKSTWYYLGSDKKKIDDACEPTSSILSYYQGLALLLPTSLPTCLFPVATNPKWEKNIEKGTVLVGRANEGALNTVQGAIILNFTTYLLTCLLTY